MFECKRARGCFHDGGVAHLGERLNGIQEVVGSIPIISTKKDSSVKRLASPFHKEKTKKEIHEEKGGYQKSSETESLC